MNNSIKCGLLLACMATVGYGQNLAMNQEPTKFQQRKVSEISKRTENYNKLKALGYEDEEIFEDLGNANFLSKKYENALYWYGRLIEVSEDGTLSKSYQKRYDHAVSQLGKKVQNEISDENWTELVKDDYKMTHYVAPTELSSNNRSNFLPWNTTSSNAEMVSTGTNVVQLNGEYAPPVALTNGGNTAYFSKATYRKPVTGLFSKKRKVHKIYKADKIAGEWKKITEVAVCPSDYSAKHPAVSPDGNRLFFASNMPGSFGAYDIYVATIHKNGNLGMAKNLGTKVNTIKDDMHPNPLSNNQLVFASEGHEGFGGLDVYLVEVGERNVGLAVNMGENINSAYDEYSVNMLQKDGSGFVVSNRGSTTGIGHHIAFNLNDKPASEKDRDYRFLEAFNTDKQMQYSSSVFDDE
ncbi:WD40-like Beta Propeller Repeat [Maribacter sedimenticola]|uniref:WD40-like Beta Propeller Repeat n=1 Tax=Maribacter sedimenticola TaxID=228956 RepID=A0ABY1SFT5_9FLAO|nr:PD40 domain-containing protein [Maribacter sedimenticola]SNR39990.1 WD40-like Beta Propeller Repeat [Maribacter sedimenticola]